MQVVATHHIAVITTQFDVMERFYTETLGFPVTKRWDEVSIIFIDVGSTTIELIARAPSDGRAGPHALGEGIGFNHLALGVADVDQAYQELVDLGVTVFREPSNFQDARTAFFTDPDGNVIELFGPPSNES